MLQKVYFTGLYCKRDDTSPFLLVVEFGLKNYPSYSEHFWIYLMYGTVVLLKGMHQMEFIKSNWISATWDVEI